ncbi:SDR family oxidoreductase [Streptomyces sp. NPDC049555]|uniref:SDR family oxidoreductase n=1 Tax=unclassified Streptomyces TaxID=2593676 RepID=UPI0034443091
MSVLLTGATGFTGSRILRRLLTAESDDPIIVLGRDVPTRLCQRIEAAVTWLDSGKLPAPNTFSRLRCLQADLTRPGLGLSPQQRAGITDGLTAVWHCAAALSLHRGPAPLYQTNVMGTRRILQLADLAPEAHLIHVSTAYVAGGRRTGRILESDLSEASGFQTPYEESKYTAERMVHQWASSRDRRVTVMRPALLIDDRVVPAGLPDQPIGVLARVLETLLRQRNPPRSHAGIPASDMKPVHCSSGALWLRVAGDAEGRLNLLQVDYAVEAMIRAAKVPGGSGVRTVHVTHPHDTTFEVVAQGLEVGCPGLRIRYVPELADPTSLESYVAEEFGHLLGFGAHRRVYDRTNFLSLVEGLPDPQPIDAAYLARALPDFGDLLVP